MKEATGELNMTVITIVAIAAIAAVFYVFVWPGIQLNLQATSACSGGPSNAGGNTDYSYECGAADAEGSFTCTITNADGETTTKTCDNGNG